MSTLFWPGDEHAGDAFTDLAHLQAMARVEAAWLNALVARGIAPSSVSGSAVAAAADGLDAAAVRHIADDAEAGGNPVIPFVSWLRARLDERDPDAARWVHRGLTSQDVQDTALMLQARDAARRVDGELTAQLGTLASSIRTYADAPMVARTLTQPAVPTTAGARLATWLHGIADPRDQVRALDFPAQFGGAAGTLSGAVALAAREPDPAGAALDLARDAAARLDLAARAPWHTTRAPVVRVVEAFAACTAAWGHVANDVLTGSRPEIGEFAESAGGGSSAMPQKANPVLSVLVRRAALTQPALVSLVQLAAADMCDERAAGAWHVEWQPLALIVRHTLTAAHQTTRLLAGLRIDTAAMAANLRAAQPGVDAERASLEKLVGEVPVGVPGGAEAALVAAALERVDGAPA